MCRLAFRLHLRVFSAFTSVFSRQPTTIKFIVTLVIVLLVNHFSRLYWIREEWLRRKWTGHCEISRAFQTTHRPFSQLFSHVRLIFTRIKLAEQRCQTFSRSCYTTLENSFFKSLESLFLNYVFFRSMLALYSVWMIAQWFSVQLYIFLVSRAYRTKALTRWLLFSSSSCTCVVCMFKLYVSKAHLNRKLNHRRLDEKQQRSDRNHAFWEQWFLGLCSSVSEFICGGPHICAEPNACGTFTLMLSL